LEAPDQANDHREVIDMKERTTTIYGLAHPVTGELRYVGKSVHPHIRLGQHIASTKKAKNQHIWVVRWIAKLQAGGLQPEMIPIEVGSEDFWREAEPFWIEYFKSLGCELLNLAPGGVGLGVMTEELKKARSRAGKIGNLNMNRDHLKNLYLVIEPDGTEHTVFGLNQWAKDRGLDSTCLVRVANGQRKQYKGWLCQKLEKPVVAATPVPNDLPVIEGEMPRLRWTVQRSNGELIQVADLKRFADDNNFTASKVVEATRNSAASKGWRAWRTGESPPENYRKKPLPGYTKTYTFISPEGQPVTTSHLPQFSQEHSLLITALYRLAGGYIDQHRGWTSDAPKISNDKAYRPPKTQTRYQLLHLATGVQLETTNISQFAREHGLTQANLFKVINGTMRQHKGWRGWRVGKSDATMPLMQPKWAIVTPEMIRYEVSNLASFGDEFGIPSGNLKTLTLGTGSSRTTGWRCYLIDDPRSHDLSPAYELIDPEGVIHTIHNLLDFTRTHDTPPYSKFSTMLMGKKEQKPCGWQIKRVKLPVLETRRHHKTTMRVNGK
jgi:hypothetical protein